MILRPALADDEAFLREMLFAALYVRPGDRPFPRSILDEPEIAHYADGFGSRAGDFGRVAIDHDEAIGACWCRVFPADDPGYGWVASETPELTVALAAGRRGDASARPCCGRRSPMRPGWATKRSPSASIRHHRRCASTSAWAS